MSKKLKRRIADLEWKVSDRERRWMAAEAKLAELHAALRILTQFAQDDE